MSCATWRTEGQHARTPGIAADLALGLRYLLDYARDAGAVTEQERRDSWERGWSALLSVAGEQQRHVTAAEPAAVFLRLFWAAVASGAASVADKDGNAPPNPQSWGWRPEEFHTGSGTDTRLKPQGRCVGWLADGELFLEPDASFAAVQRFAQERGTASPSPRTPFAAASRKKTCLPRWMPTGGSSPSARRYRAAAATCCMSFGPAGHPRRRPAQPAHKTNPTRRMGRIRGPKSATPTPNRPTKTAQ